ncbi:DUF4861 domain-containing protein [Chryseobacterium sp. Ch-15]|uniref:DUF4861 domain-containing protein n=1 Tax=Chryseobacterium muglaense TaxID=2893752 RepID=A0A9Q3UX44_9FLAO|nr:DUF4861 family protein [Chryseobacterium muglaense]MBD3903493.1 DUF4861 family protein [Chryseobacterium muglaense]MCC9034565.1 DUF4861 domain-containing protein [Chryseobacterium muglaense]MCM2552828.1 DUF4861 domain-containing protein [Chryseobacterium muglaense]
MSEKLKSNIFKIILTGAVFATNTSFAQQNVIEKIRKNPKTPFSYAELSIKDGGKWQGNEYIGGSFKNVNELTLPAEHTDHSYYIRYEGIGLENNQIGYRLYLDWRNATDIFGKKVNTLVLPEVGQDGFETYHHDAPWGQDILKSGRTIGIGSYGRYDEQNDFVETFKTVKSTTAKVFNENDKSFATIDYKGWKTWGKAVDLQSKLTIFNKDRFVKVDLSLDQTLSGLCTGIVAFKDIPMKQGISKNKKWGYIATYGTQTLAKKEDNLGMVVFYPIENFDKYVKAKSTHIVVFKKTKNVSYYFMGAWSQEPNGLKTEEEFYKDLDKKLDILDNNNQL